MIKVQCDRCKREIEPKEDIGYMSWCFKEGGVDGDLSANILEGQHFCERCMDRIMKIIKRCYPCDTVDERERNVSENDRTLSQKR